MTVYLSLSRHPVDELRRRYSGRHSYSAAGLHWTTATQHDTSCDVVQVSSELRQVLRLPEGGAVKRGGRCPRASSLRDPEPLPHPETAWGKGAGPCYKAGRGLVRREEEAPGWQPPSSELVPCGRRSRRCRTGPGHSVPCRQTPPRGR